VREGGQVDLTFVYFFYKWKGEGKKDKGISRGYLAGKVLVETTTEEGLGTVSKGTGKNGKNGDKGSVGIKS